MNRSALRSKKGSGRRCLVWFGLVGLERFPLTHAGAAAGQREDGATATRTRAQEGAAGEVASIGSKQWKPRHAGPVLRAELKSSLAAPSFDLKPDLGIAKTLGHARGRRGCGCGRRGDWLG